MRSSQALPESNNDSSTAPTKPFSLSLSSSSASKDASKKTSINIKSSNRNTKPQLARRTHQLRQDDEFEDEDESAPVHEEVTGFDTQTGSAITIDGQDAKTGKRELIIPVSSQNNWRDRPGVNIRRPRGKNLLPREVQAIQEAERSGKPIENVGKDAPSMAYGLSYAEPSMASETQAQTGIDGGDQQMQDAEPLLPPPTEEQKPLTQDEIALQALVRESGGDAERRTDIVIESKKPAGDGEEDEHGELYDGTSSFRTDVASRPEPATLDAYNNIPVEEFGAALLRGMGWKEGQPVGRGRYNVSAPGDRVQKPRIPQRRPGFLGIGAKDLSGKKGAEAEIGAWGKAAMRKSSKKSEKGSEGSNTDGVYMPVLMKNRNTGEYITEEELGDIQKEAKKRRDEGDWRERRDRNLERSGRNRDDRSRDRNGDHRERRKRDYDDDIDRYERRKHGSSRRDRSLSSGSRHSRRGKYDDRDIDGRDDRYYRDRDRRDRDRDRGRDKDSDRDKSHRHRDDDRHASSRHSSRYSHDRERDRGSSRGSHRRRREDDR